jgi:hypothetical protein
VGDAVEVVNEARRAEQLRRPNDPPYGPVLVLPLMRIEPLVRDPSLDAAYPDPAGLPFAGSRQVHYAAPGYYVDIPTLSRAERQAQVSPNFVLEEYVRLPERNGDPRCYIDPQIAQHVQDLRDAWGGPLILTSTYRSPRYNAAIGGAIYSRHMYGDALDVAVPDARRARDFYNLALAIGVDFVDAFDNTIRADGSGWVHIDNRGF